MDDDLRIVERKEIDLRGAVLVEGFPSVGMVSSIVANYMINKLDMDYIGSVRSRFFNPTAVISGGVPMPPVRIYGGQPAEKEGCICDKLVVLTSEFPPPVELISPLVGAILDWAGKKGIKLITSLEGIVNETPDHQEPETYAIGSTERSRKLLMSKKVEPMQNGIVTGISGVLLHEAELADRDVICLLADANPQIPDARAAAGLIEVLDLFLPKLKLDPQPLREEAEKVESQLKKALAQSQTYSPSGGEQGQMMYG